jgi:hypothetical protein
VSGNFKIDSAVQILAKPSMIEPQGGMTMSEHSHSAETQPMQMERVERIEHSATSEQQHEAGDLRQGRQEDMERERKSEEQGDAHQHDDPQEKMEMEEERD